MSTVNLNRDELEINSGLDSVVIVNALGDIPGGRALDVSDVASGTTILKAGHVVISATVDGVTTYKPMPLNAGGTAYGTLPSGYAFAGILKTTIPVKDPRAAIVTMGQINAAACPFAFTSAMKTALSHIQFLNS